MPFQNGVRVTREWWVANRPDLPPGTIVDPETGRTTIDLTSAGRTDEDATTEDVRTRKRSGQRAAGALAAIANAMAVEPDSPEMAAIDLTGGEEEPLYPERYAPWLDGVAPDGADAPESAGPVTRAREQAFGALKGFVSSPNRPSQRGAGRHKRHVVAKAKAWGVTPEAADLRVGGDHADCPWRAS